MSTSGVNYFYDLLGIRKSAFKIYYDFSGIHGSQVPSVSGASSDYPANIVGNLNVLNDSGSFDKTIYLEPQNIDSFDIKNWSVIVNYEKKDSKECLFFNSLVTGNVSSGFQLGLTDTNKMYFKYYDSGEPFYYTSDNIIGSKNLLSFSKSKNLIEFSYYDFNKKAFETESYLTNDRFLFYSDQFKLFEDFSGYTDGFIYFDGNVSYSNRQRLCSGFFLDPVFITGRISITGYELYKTGNILGNNKIYETGLKILTGNLNYSNESIRIQNADNLDFFGIITDGCDISDQLYIYDGIYTGKISSNSLYPLTGFLVSESHISGGYVEPIEISGIQVTGYIESVIPIYTGITGSIQEQKIDYIDDCGRPVFSYNDIFLTGVLSGEELIPLTGWVSTNLGSGLDFYKNGGLNIQNVSSSSPYQPNNKHIYSYGMEFVTYTFEEDDGDLQEIIVFPEQQGLTSYNKRPFYEQPTRSFVLDKEYDYGQVNIFLNGLLQYQSGFNVSGDVFNVLYVPQVDYFLSGANIRSNGFYDTGDLMIFDAPVPSAKKISDFDDQISFLTSGVFTGFPIYETDLVFLNGQKLYSGANYVISGGQWMKPISGFEGITGVISTIKKYVGELSFTGNYDKLENTKFPRNTSIYFSNGVRIPRFQYVEHASIDLISGNNISLKGAESLYNNDGLTVFWE